MKKALSRKNIWSSTPRFLKSSLGRVLGTIPPRWLLGKRYREQCSFVRKAQWWSQDRIKEYQYQQLKAIITLAYTETIFYRNLFNSCGFHPGDFKSLDDIGYLPTIDRHMIPDDLQCMCTKSIQCLDIDFGTTGGKSGIPLRLYFDANRSSVEYAYLTTSWERIDYKVTLPMAVIRGKSIRSDRDGLWYDYDPILRHHYYSSFHMSDENMKRYLEHIATIGPCYLHVYPSTIVALARCVLRLKLPVPRNIKGAIAESEIVYPEQREMIEHVFGVRLLSCYGQTEKVVLAAGCEHANDYHVWPTYGYFELLDEEGNQVTTPGRRGEIVGTGFINTMMPFIRYRTGDWATYVGERCTGCGREHVVIRDIRGHRTQEILIAADGSEISWTALNMHDDTFINVRQFQFVQDTPGEAVLSMVPADGFNGSDTERIKRNIGRKLNGQLTFTIKLVDAIPLTPRGKTVYVDQRIT